MYVCMCMIAVVSFTFHMHLQLKHCRVGQTVRVIDDLSRMHQLQSDADTWIDEMLTVWCDNALLPLRICVNV